MSDPISLLNPILFSKNFLFHIAKAVDFNESDWELIIKFLSSGLNIKCYSRLSKGAGDFKGL